MKKKITALLLSLTCLAGTVLPICAAAAETAAGTAAGTTDRSAAAETAAESGDGRISEGSTGIASVGVDKNNVNVRVTLTKADAEKYKGRKLFLFELYPYQTAANIGAFDPTDYKVIDGSEYVFSLPFDKNSDQMYARYLCALLGEEGLYTVITDEEYIGGYESFADYVYPYPQFASKKGLSFRYLSDALSLGVSHTVLTVPINEYFVAQSDDAASFEHCGRTYYIDSARLEALDYKIRTYSEAGINIYLDIVLTAPTETQPDELDCLYASEYASSVTYYAVNSGNSSALGYFNAALAFLAGRYTRPDREYGFAGSYIIGYQVNSNRYYNNYGECELGEYADAYTRLLRSAEIALDTVYSGARIYVPLANNFTEPSINSKVQTNARYDYTSRDILDALAERASDISWNVAFYPYASDYENSSVWQDEDAVSGFGTPYITASNIELLCEYLSQSEFLYRGEKRSIAVAEFGVNGNPEDEDSLADQAASFAYGYYKAAAQGMIESVIYYRQVDSLAEEGVYFGLWETGSDESTDMTAKKPIYDVFKYIDTPRSTEFSTGYISRLGAAGWDAVVPGFYVEQFGTRELCEGSPIEAGRIPYSYTRFSLFDFNSGSLHGFRPTEGAASVDIREASGIVDDKGNVVRASALYAALSPSGKNEYVGVSRYFPSGLTLEDIHYIGFSIKADASIATSDVKVMLRLSSSADESGAGYADYIAESEVTAGEWSRVCFDVSSITDSHTEYDRMSIWIADAEGNRADGSYAFWLSGIDVYKKDISRVTRVVLVIACIVLVFLAVACVIAATRIAAVKRRRSRELEQQREYEEMQRAEEQARRREELLRVKAEEIARAQDSGEMHSNGQKALKRRFDRIKNAESERTQAERSRDDKHNL